MRHPLIDPSQLSNLLQMPEDGRMVNSEFFVNLSCSCGEGNSNPFQYSCLENPMDGGAWWAAVHGIARSRTRLSDFTLFFHFHAEKEMATHSSVLAWRIPGTGDPGGLLSMGSHRVGHEWSDAAACSCKRITFNDALNRSLLTSDGQPLHSSSSRLSSPLQNFLYCHYCFHT